MVSKIPGGLSSDEFDMLIDNFIEQEDPHAISLDVVAELSAQNRQRAATPPDPDSYSKKTLGNDVWVRLEDGQLKLFPLARGSRVEVANNEIRFPNGWRVVLQVEPPAAVAE